jgi:(p)ppGpp synthase/HD superfamily hydrolase
MTCALLHDTCEDAGIEPAQIAEAFGTAVAQGVQALTKNDALPKAARMADCLDRIRRQPREIWLVKLADRITNLEPAPPDWSPDKCRAYAVEARLIRSRLAGASPVVEQRLDGKIAAYEALLPATV